MDERLENWTQLSRSKSSPHRTAFTCQWAAAFASAIATHEALDAERVRAVLGRVTWAKSFD
jgi:hypothetical protein